VAITDPPAELRPGMTASADIVTDTKDSTLSVPIQCVTVRTLEQLKAGKEGKEADEAVAGFEPDEDGFVQVVFVLEGDTVAARQVKTGIQGENLIEVVDGLEKGATLISGSYRAISRDLVPGARVEVNNEPAKADEA
jgi:HlyD family secretion protein